MNMNSDNFKIAAVCCTSFANNIVCHFATTYMDGETPFLFVIFKGGMTMIAYAKFNEFLTVGYFLNGLLDVTVTLLNTLLCL